MPYRSLLPQRRLEWWLASYTCVWGLFLVLTPSGLDGPSYTVMRAWAPPAAWGCLSAFVGMFHWWALFINGRRHWSSYVRAAATVANALVFTLALSAVIAAVREGFSPPTATLVIYLAPVWASVCAFWVAAHDSYVAWDRRVVHYG